ncbi:MAG: DnaA N-terminal domain-containing protein, partial [Amylibacter sp.]
MEFDCWGRVRGQLQSVIGKDAFQNWIEPLNLLKVTDGVACFSAPTSFVGTWVDRNYGDKIAAMMTAEGIVVN